MFAFGRLSLPLLSISRLRLLLSLGIDDPPAGSFDHHVFSAFPASVFFTTPFTAVSLVMIFFGNLYDAALPWFVMIFAFGPRGYRIIRSGYLLFSLSHPGIL